MPPCSNAHLAPGDSLVFKYQPTLLEPIKDKNATLLSETTLVAISIDSGIIIWQYSLGKPDSYNNSIRALQEMEYPQLVLQSLDIQLQWRELLDELLN